MEPNGTPTPTTTPAPQSGPPQTPPPASAPPASVPGSGPGTAGGAAPAAGAGAPSAGVAAPAPAFGANGQGLPAQPANPFAGLTPEAQAQIASLRQRAEMFDRYQTLIPLGYRAYQQAGGNGQPQPQAPGQPAAPQTNVFGLPAQFNFDLLNYVERDPNTGQLVTRPGGPPDAAIQVANYQERLQKAQRDFWQNPEQFLGDLIEKRAQKAAEQMYQQRFQGHQEGQQANAILQQNAGWLFEQQNGQQVTQFDPASGQYKPVLTEFGRLYAGEVQKLVQQGVRDPQMQHQYALAAVQNIAYAQQLRQQQAPAQGQAAAQQFINNAAAAPPGVTHPPAPTPTPAEPAAGFSLRDRMSSLMSGINEQQFQAQFRGAA